jgi:cyclomaltodextrinase / maltogenic alpha-amylase / neopullulanase
MPVPHTTSRLALAPARGPRLAARFFLLAVPLAVLIGASGRSPMAGSGRRAGVSPVHRTLPGGFHAPHIRPSVASKCSPAADGEAAGSEQPVPVTLTYIPTGAPRTVTVAGTFNRWNRSANPLRPRAGTLVWTARLELPPGVYQYRFVINGSRWITPQDAPRINDGSGTINAVLVVAPKEYAALPARLGDGQITASGVLHEVAAAPPPSTARAVRYVVRADSGHIDLTLRTRRGDVEACSLRTPGPTPARPAGAPMTRYASDALFDYWRARVEVPAGASALRYVFLLRDGPALRIYDNAGALWNTSHEIRWFQLMPTDFPPFETPDWARDAIFYQIFPDRFADGDKKNDPPDTDSWESRPTSSKRMGGDLAGVIEHIEYLRDLGVNALYLNPIFASRSNHGYDTTDYKKIDPRFGTTAELKSLTARAHLHGWHVILDGVFNHTGVDFEAFKSVLAEGPNSPYRDWYFIHGFPVRIRQGTTRYEGWNGSQWMPKLNVANPATRDFLLDVGTHWINEAKIDGWRLDAANEVDHAFWKAFRKRIKAARPDAYLVGEVWPDARDWLQGDEMDSVTNYRWRGAVLDFFAFDKTSPYAFDAALAQIRTDYPPQATAVMFNILGSHDVERIRTVCRDDWSRERQAVAFQMTYPGTPCIYYGDEVGLEGGKDPDNRRPMPWSADRWDKATLAFYKEAIALRKRHAVLRRGDYQTVAADDRTGVYACLRAYKNERALIAFNRSDSAQRVVVPIAKVGALPYAIWLDGGSKPERQGDNLVISLPKRGFAVLGH